MNTIRKYVLGATVQTQVSTYEKAQFLHVDEQNGRITVWAEVNTMGRECRRTLHVVETGGEVPFGVDYVGTALLVNGRYVFHVYVEREAQ